MKVCGSRVRYSEVGNKSSSSVEFVEFFDRNFAAPVGLCYKVLDAIHKLFLLSEG